MIDYNPKVDEYGFPIVETPSLAPKYKGANDNYFGFELFEEIFQVINERTSSTTDSMFNNGIASAEAAVRRLREEYYEAIKKVYESKD